MKATELLKTQHQVVRELFQRIEDSEDRSEQIQLFEELATNLVAHDAIEREIFYPACEEEMGMSDLLGESLVEHGLVEFLLFQVDQSAQSRNQEEEAFVYKCTVLKEIVEHHVKEEEEEFFPQVEKALGDQKLEDLAEEMQESFEDHTQQDFRPGLFANLRQVLAGAVKTDVREEDLAAESLPRKNSRRAS
jgi:hemerythrin-like domain-containing protein